MPLLDCNVGKDKESVAKWGVEKKVYVWHIRSLCVWVYVHICPVERVSVVHTYCHPLLLLLLFALLLPLSPSAHSVLSLLSEMFSGVRPSEVVLEPAVRAGLEALKAAQRNGRVFVFHTGLPSAQAPGQLKNRLDSKLLGTVKEKVRICSIVHGVSCVHTHVYTVVCLRSKMRAYACRYYYVGYWRSD